MAMKSNPQAFFDDGFNGNATNIFSYDDFFVDDLLNFSNEDVEKGFVEEEKECSSVSSQEQTENDNTNYSRFSSKNDFGSISGSELSIPTEDLLAELEWLSHFVDDSFSEFSLPCQTGNTTEKKTQNQAQPETEELSSENPCFPVYFPAKARSKRSRISGRAWSLGSLSFSESSSLASESSSSSSQATSLVFTNSYSQPPAKKQKKKKLTDTGGSQSERRCSHCHVQKTPQWRTGPLGAKTLCNACGVRYKSGRLLPEYRPAISPTFSGEFHSNNHRKVLDMRRKKEIVGAEPGLPPAAHSY